MGVTRAQRTAATGSGPEMQGFVMTRRNSELNLRQAISEILEQTYAIEYSMGLFYRKGSQRELVRAGVDFEIMRAAVDRLSLIVSGAHENKDASEVVEQAA